MRPEKITAALFNAKKCHGQTVSLQGEYSDLSLKANYGNGCCDGFSPNFPLIRRFAEPMQNIQFDDILSRFLSFVNTGKEKFAFFAAFC